MHGGTHSCKIYKPLPQQGLINRLSGIKSSNPFDTDSICDYASQAMLKEHGQPRPCSFKFVRLYVNSWDRGKRKNVVAYILSFPSVSAVLLVLLLPSLLFLTQILTDGASLRFLMKQVGNIPLAVVHHQRIVFYIRLLINTK